MSTDQLTMFDQSAPETVVALDCWDLPRHCLKHDLVHTTNECHTQVQAAEDAFEAAGGLEGKDVGDFWAAIKVNGYEYGGFYILADGSRRYSYSDRKTNRGHTIHVNDWDGTAQGLHDNADRQDSAVRKVMGGLL